jgi:cation/acetate symporter
MMTTQLRSRLGAGLLALAASPLALAAGPAMDAAEK